jgi:thiamine pyrophosphokinase
VITEGLEYPLGGESMEPGSTRGVSNSVVAAPARVRIAAGHLLCITTALSAQEDDQ